MMRKTDYIIVILFALSLLGAYSIYKPFLLSISVALLLTMATANVHKSITFKVSSEYLSATFLTLMLFIILFVPIIYIATIGAQYLSTMDASIVTKVTNKLISISEDIPILHEWLGENFTDEKILEFIKESKAQ